MDLRDFYNLGKSIELSPRYGGNFAEYTTDELLMSVQRINDLLTTASVMKKNDNVVVFDARVEKLILLGRDCVRKELIKRMIP